MGFPFFSMIKFQKKNMKFHCLIWILCCYCYHSLFLFKRCLTCMWISFIIIANHKANPINRLRIWLSMKVTWVQQRSSKTKKKTRILEIIQEKWAFYKTCDFFTESRIGLIYRCQFRGLFSAIHHCHYYFLRKRIF